jgi:ABC-type uncharacterized transport system involved in gliding motility auxiliary subunit
MRDATLRTILAAICICVITLCAALIVNKLTGTARIADLTENDIYTLSPGTRNIIDKVNEPVHLKLYYTRTAAAKGPEWLKPWNVYYNYVEDLLNEYAAHSDGRITLQSIDPRPYSEAEEEAVQYGLKRFRLPGEESFIFGLVAETEYGKVRTLEIFSGVDAVEQRPQYLEYQISRLLTELIQREKKVLGIVSSLELAGMDLNPYVRQMMMQQGRTPPEPWQFVNELRRQYDVRDLDLEEGEVPEDVDFLMVVHPKGFSEPVRFAIDQFLMRGGKLMVFTDPYCFSDQPEDQRQAMQHDASSNLNGLLSTWGVEMTPGAIVVSSQQGQVAQVRRNAPQVRLPQYLLLGEEGVNSDHMITQELSEIQMLLAGELARTGDAKVTAEPLLFSAGDGQVWTPGGPWEIQQMDPTPIREAVSGTLQEARTLAYLVTGAFETNFPDGIDLPVEEEEDAEGEPQEEEAGEPAEPEHLDAVKAAAEEAALLVVSDVDCISDHLAYQQHPLFGWMPAGENVSFLFNALDYLAGSKDLISVRSKSSFERPFTRVEEIRRDVEEETLKERERYQERLETTQRELNQLRQGSAEGLRGDVLEKIRSLEQEAYKAQKKIRSLKNESRERIEALKFRMQLWSILAAPGAVLLVAIILAIYRTHRARQYAARRGES